MKTTNQTIAEAQAEFARQQIGGGIRESLPKFYRRAAALLIDRPELITITIDGSGDNLAIQARPNPDDASKMIGAKGAMYHSFRSLLNQYAAIRQIRLHYQLDTERPGVRKVEPPFAARADWPREWLEKEFSVMIAQMFTMDRELAGKNADDNSTHYSIALHPDEPVHLSDIELKDALGKIWHAAGRKHGREIYLDHLKRRRATA